MKPFLNILVGVNYTDSSRQALAEAARLASENGARVTACHVVPLGELTEFVDFYVIEHAEMLNAARSSLEGFTEEVLGKGHDVACTISEGIPHHELVSKANEEGYDLLVLGDDDYADDSRKAGQFTIKCLRFTTMPVLLVNRPFKDTSGAIAACIDFSKSSQTIFEHAAQMNLDSSSPLAVIHACRPPWLRPLRLRYRTEVRDEGNLKEEYREVLHERIATICQQASALLPNPPTPILLENDDPTKALVQHLEESQYRLIVIGRAGKGWKSLVSDFLGGTAEAVIRHAQTHILIVPISK